jgi:hypothetical protein
VPADALRATAQQLGETIAQQRADHLATIKRALWDALEDHRSEPPTPESVIGEPTS